MTCANAGGLCSGSCGGFKVFVRAGAEADPTAAAPAESGSSTLSGGAIAGIVIGSIVGVALIALAVVFIVKRFGSSEQSYSAVMQ